VSGIRGCKGCKPAEDSPAIAATATATATAAAANDAAADAAAATAAAAVRRPSQVRVSRDGEAQLEGRRRRRRSPVRRIYPRGLRERKLQQ
jgi:hypothetical protein